jgi:hypothetical protein
MNKLINYLKNCSCQFDDRTVNQRTVSPRVMGQRLFKQHGHYSIDWWGTNVVDHGQIMPMLSPPQVPG